MPLIDFAQLLSLEEGAGPWVVQLSEDTLNLALCAMSLLDELDGWEIDGEELSIFDWIAATGILSQAQWELQTEVSMGEVFVDRGNPNAWDYTIGAGLTADGTWRSRSLQGVINDVSSVRVLLQMACKDNAAGSWLQVRPFGASNSYNTVTLPTHVSGIYNFQQCQIYLVDGDQIEYKITAGMDNAMLLVCGWWVPAG